MSPPFDHLARAARSSPAAVLFDAGSQAMSYGDAHRHAVQIARALREAGIRPGHRVALDMPIPLHLLFMEALFHEAAVSFQLPRVAGEPRPLRADWLLSATGTSSSIARDVIPIDGAFLRAVQALPDAADPIPYPEPTALCRIVFSSGTTGYPKPVGFSVEMIERRARDATRFWMHRPPFMSALDVTTVSGFQAFYASVMHGDTYLVPGDPAHNVAQINRHGVKSIKASPIQVAALAAEIGTSGAAVPTLEVIQFAGASLPGPVAAIARTRTGAEIHNLYGSTETGNVSARYIDSDDPYDAGMLTPETEVQIVDEQDRELPRGAEGIIRYRRPQQAGGYVDDPEATATAFRDGWFYPGDRGTLDGDDHLTLAGRVSEIVNAGGVKVDPQRVDSFAVGLPGIDDAAAFTFTDDLGLTQFALAIVPLGGFDFEATAAALQDAFGSACPGTLVQVETIPRNAMGKALRAELTRLFDERGG